MIPLLLLSAGCGEKVRIEPLPVTLQSCADEPVAPNLAAVDWTSLAAAREGQKVRDLQMVDYVLAWRSAWGDCKAKVAGGKAWSEKVK